MRLVRGVDAASPVLACYEEVIHGGRRSVVRVYVSMVARRLWWALRATTKVLLRRTPVAFCELEWLSLWHDLAALPSLVRAFRHRGRLMEIAGAGRWAGADAC
jgi:hypothetical protein